MLITATKYLPYFFLFPLLTTFGLNLNGQIPNDYGYIKYKEEFPKESVLFLDVSIVDEYTIKEGALNIRRKKREEILYLDKQAFSLSERSVFFDLFTSIDQIEATCFYPQNGKYKKERVKEFIDKQSIPDDYSFYDDSKKKEFNFQNLREGAVTVLEYELSFNDPHLIYGKTFTNGLFHENDSYTIKVHKDIDLGYETFNMDESEILFDEKQKGDYKILSWKREKAGNKRTYGSDEAELYYLPQIIPYIKTYKSEGEEVPIFRNLDDLYNWYTSLVKKVKPIKNEKLKALGDSLTRDADSDIEKVKRIYYWVQDQLKYIAFGDGYGGFVPRDPDLIYDRRFGDCKDMSCLTINLLNELEIPSFYSWVGTRSIPYNYSQIASPQVDNHMIATYIDDKGQIYYLDATDPNLEFGRPSYAIQGKELLIGLNENEYLLDTIPFIDAQFSSEFDTAFLHIEENVLIGKGSILLSGYLAEDVYAYFEKNKEIELFKKFKRLYPKGSNKFNGKKVDYYQPSQSKDSLRIVYEFEVDSYVNSIEDQLYLNLNLTKHLKDLKIEERTNVPVLMDYKYHLEKDFFLELPKEYVVDFLPENSHYESAYFSYSLNYKKLDDKIHYQFRCDRKAVYLSPEEITQWNEALAHLSDRIDETIKLKKTPTE